MSKKIYLRGKYKKYYVLVDDEDYERLNKFNWFLNIQGSNLLYAHRNTRKDNKRFKLKIHHEILNPPEGYVIDHINHNTLDNRRSNLRIVTKRENCINRINHGNSEYPGVHKRSDCDRWVVRIWTVDRGKHIGMFDDEIKAAEAYENALKEIAEGKSYEELTTYRAKQSSDHIGVCWHEKRKKWRAYITKNRKTIELGFFDSEGDAYNARKEAEKTI